MIAVERLVIFYQVSIVVIDKSLMCLKIVNDECLKSLKIPHAGNTVARHGTLHKTFYQPVILHFTPLGRGTT
jgi:hypothetical protein